MEHLLIVLWGFVFGLLAGLTGVGTGSIGTAGLLLFFHFDPKAAIAANILNGAVMKTSGTVKHFLHDHPKVGLGIPFVVGGAPASVVGSLLSGFITTTIFKLLIGGTLVCVSLLLIWEVYYLPEVEKGHSRKPDGKKKILALICGVIVGFIAGLTSVGTGTLMIASMLIILRLPSKAAVGTTLFCGAIILGTSALTHTVAGHTDFMLALNLMAGSIPGVWIGSHFCAKAPVRQLRVAIAVLILIAGAKLLFK